MRVFDQTVQHLIIIQASRVPSLDSKMSLIMLFKIFSRVLFEFSLPVRLFLLENDIY